METERYRRLEYSGFRGYVDVKTGILQYQEGLWIKSGRHTNVNHGN